jgi:IclR-like helix-turn-helix domain-containing protein
MSTVIEDLKRLEERILARIKELEANDAELEQLRDVAQRLGILDGSANDADPATPRAATATAATRTRRPNRARTAGTGGGTRTGTRARPGGARSATALADAVPAGRQSTRRERVLEVVGVTPGISVREIVAQLGVNRTSLYPVVRQLVSDGLLYKDGPGLWPVAT